MNIHEIITEFENHPVIIFHDRAIDYREFAELLDRQAHFLSANSVRPGEVVAFDGVYTPETCALLVALIENRSIIVPLPAGPEAKRAEFLDFAEVECQILGDGTVRRTARISGHPLYQRLRDAAAPGLVLFSSGTTGRSKASVLDFAKLLANYDRSKLRPRRTLGFLSLDHIGGINTLMNTLVHGGCVVTTAERTPQAVFSAIETYGADTLPTTPTFLTMSLLSGELARRDLSALKLITYGTEPMPPQTLKKLCETLPGIRLKQTYGLSEVGILPTMSKDDSSLWMKLGSRGFEHKILDGILWIKSDMAMLGYLNAPAPFDDDGFFNTQDAVEIDGDYIKVLGRKSELINVGGEKVYPNEVESVLLEMEGVVEATVSGKPSAITGMVVRAVLRLSEPEPAATLRERVRAHCGTRLEPFKVPVVVELTDRPMHSDRLKKVRAV
nr:fatty acid--CoA ligase family protein [Breoghania corrubedonensis]